MKLQYLCHFRIWFAIPLLFGFTATGATDEAVRTEVVAGSAAPRRDAPAHDYPTIARVEYVNECVATHGDKLAAVYQCACAIDRIADVMAYDEYVEASTYAKYASLPGQAGGIFRDSAEGRKLAKNFRELETRSLQSCGMAR